MFGVFCLENDWTLRTYNSTFVPKSMLCLTCL